MKKNGLKQMIKEILNEIDFAPRFRPTHDLTIVSTVTGNDLDDLKKYVSELHKVLTAAFGDDVVFEEKLKKSILSNKDKKIETTFTIINIIDDLMLKTVREYLQDMHEALKKWSQEQDLVLDINFTIKENDIQLNNSQELNVLSSVTSAEINLLKQFISELHDILIYEFDEDVTFEKKLNQLNIIKLKNNDRKIDYKFKITNITSKEDLELVKETLEIVQEKLTKWSINQKSKINFIFTIG